MVIKFDFIKICKFFPTQAFPRMWSLRSDSTKMNSFGFVKNFDVVLQYEDETGKSRFFG